MIKKNILQMKNKNLHKHCQNPLTTTNIPNFIKEYNIKEKIQVINENFEDKITEFQKNPKGLVIVTDFDYTLTKRYHSEGNLYSSYCVLEFSKFISENYRKQNKELFDKYAPMEHDITIDYDIREEYIKKWFKENLDLILVENLTRENFQHMVMQAEQNFFFRYGILELFELIRNNSIPIYIISGGIYEIIDEALKITIPYYAELQEKKLINIVANRFSYDENNKLSGYIEPFVYTFNKGEVRIFVNLRY